MVKELKIAWLLTWKQVDSDLANKMAGIDVDEEEDVVSFEEFAGGEPIFHGTSPEVRLYRLLLTNKSSQHHPSTLQL